MDIGLGHDTPEASTSSYEPRNKPVSDVRTFLKDHPSAKIVVVIDTHCLDNGAFVYQGSTPMSYAACYLPEASTTSHFIIVAAADSHTDTQGLHPVGGPKICLGWAKDPETSSQKPDPKPCMWSIR